MTNAPAASNAPRVGHIEFLNCLPLYWGLESTGALDAMRLVADTPDRLSDALIAGDLDIGPISLVEALRRPDEVVVLPDLAVGSDGEVLSVCLVSKVPLGNLDGGVVALGNTSRTSVLLARLILEQRAKVIPRYIDRAPDLGAMLAEADAAVLIGDVALQATLRAASDDGVVVTDLGAAWREWTGLPMVFAVWAARRSYFDSHPDKVRFVADAFGRSVAAAAEHPEAVAQAAVDSAGLSLADAERYYKALDFSLGPRQRDGIEAFTQKITDLLGWSAAPRLTYL
jgi:chorismate dehydratase